MEMIFYAPVWGQSGFEKLSRELIMALDQMGVVIELRPALEWNQERVGLPNTTVMRLRRMMENRVNALAPHVIYQLPRGQQVIENAPVVCYTLFETDRCPQPWMDAFSRCDKIFVFSEFNRKGWIESGIPEHKISALPQAVDSFMYTPDGPKTVIENKKGFTFLCSGDFTERKNFEAVIEAYVKEFTNRDDVTLIFKCHYGGFTKKYRRECASRLRDIAMRFNPDNPPRILFWGDKVSDYAMASLYRSVDCFILCSRGEGLGMQYLEAMASGVPVIACDWGAQMDYLNQKNAFLVRTNLKIIDDPNYILKCPQALNNKWCQAEIGDIQQNMRYVFQDYADASSRAELNLEAVRKMTWQRMAISFISGIITMFDHKKELAAV
jgi:glycosyltransferase involved in cell wall biosynthesis